jgi:hypothetical protein
MAGVYRVVAPFIARNSLIHERRELLDINVLGGVAVLGSYVWGALHPESFRALWGGVPDALRPLYTINMFLAAAGYLIVLATIVRAHDRALRSDPVALYALILIPSALWLPLTFIYLDHPSSLLWLAIRLDLASVGIGAVSVLIWLMAVKPGPTPLSNRIAVVAMIPFVLQTAVLDALIWPAYFPS